MSNRTRTCHTRMTTHHIRTQLHELSFLKGLSGSERAALLTTILNLCDQAAAGELSEIATPWENIAELIGTRDTQVAGTYLQATHDAIARAQVLAHLPAIRALVIRQRELLVAPQDVAVAAISDMDEIVLPLRAIGAPAARAAHAWSHILSNPILELASTDDGTQWLATVSGTHTQCAIAVTAELGHATQAIQAVADPNDANLLDTDDLPALATALDHRAGLVTPPGCPADRVGSR
ncbi:hypothetical protein [Amycolatopsis anabasis]|uniref:hypothetical protein n=1 Tax=Amycolatopsis anabasis TaxID=1840409 RepID=UPI00131AADCB|nr:hypothetical protein [Amycolatopsis anabasis]